jgi:hypothetical protein
MRLLALPFAILFLAGCNACDREPCDSFSKPAPGTISQGIGGTVSVESDAVVDGCHLCAFSRAVLDVWPAPMAVRAAPVACPLAVAGSARKVDAAGRYDQALEPGEYLICVSSKSARPCIGVTVAAGKLTTLNIKHGDGPDALAVQDPTGGTFRSDTFDCPGS